MPTNDHAKMNIVPIEFSIVVVGEDCNPTILNPDFLKHRRIVPEEWGWELGGPPITTPALSIVPYASGVLIKVEPKRFQVTDTNGVADVGESSALAIARRYIEVVPHVRYTAVGNNFRAFLEMEHAEAFLKDRFIKPGPWNDEEQPLGDVTLSFSYPHEDSRLALSLERKVLMRKENEKIMQVEGIEIGANFHRDCQGYPTDGQVLAHIAKAPEDSSYLQALMARVLVADARVVH